MKRTKYIDSKVGGLANLGNTCYLNSAIQCLSHCHTFLDYILTHDFQDQESVASNLQELLKITWLEDSSVVPRKFIKYMAQACKDTMYLHEQNDLQEFLMLLIDMLNKSICKQIPHSLIEREQRKMNRQSNPMLKFQMDIHINWLKTHQKEYSTFIDMLYGMQVYQIKCRTCGHLLHNYESFSILPIACSSEERTDLSQLLHNHMQKEQLSHINCEKCKNQTLDKSTKFWTLPEILIVVFKRFDHNLNKINNKINVPEYLNLDEYTLYDSRCAYELKSIACHSGSLHSGHYCALCKHPNGKWLIFDDDTIQEVDTYSKVNPSLYYVAFYERAATP